MDGLYHIVESLLDRHPAPAISPEEIRTALSRETGAGVPDTRRLLRSLESGGGPIRVLRRPRRRWKRKLGPRAWVFKTRAARRQSVASSRLQRRLRSSLRALGRVVEPTSAQAWARWTRMIEEEARVRESLRAR